MCSHNICTLFAGFYADVEARCQVFHVCGLSSGSLPQQSFLCPNGTIFNVLVKTCDWWTNVECSLQEVEKPLYTSGEETQHSLPSTQLSNKKTNVPDKILKDELYDYLPTIGLETQEKINVNREKFLLSAFNTKVDTNENFRNNFSNTLASNVVKDAYYGLKSVVREGSLPIDVRTDKEVTIRPRLKYTQSVMTSSTKSPVFSVTTFLDPMGNTFEEFNESTKQNNEYTEYERTKEMNSLQRPWQFFENGSGTETYFTNDSNDNETINTSVVSKSTNDLHQHRYYSEKVSQKVSDTTKQYPFVPTNDLYLDKTKPLDVPGIYSIQNNTNATQDGSKIKFNFLVQQDVDKKITNNLSSIAEKYLNRYLHGTKDTTFTLPLPDSLNSTKRGNIYDSENTSYLLLKNPPYSSNSFGVNKTGTSPFHEILIPSLSSDSVDNYSQAFSKFNSFDNDKLLNKELGQEFSISKHNLTYQEHTESLPEYSKIQLELFRNTKNSSDSYVNVPYFSSFPELYNSSVSGYYITELPPKSNQLAPDISSNDDKAKNRSTRLDGDGNKLVSKTKNPVEIIRDLSLSETESVYTKPDSKSTALNEESEFHNSKVNFNTPVTTEPFLQDTTKTLSPQNNAESHLENDAILGPAISFENSHVAWPIFPPRSVFYSPYPVGKNLNSQFGATESLYFFPHPRRIKNGMHPTNNNENYYNYANNNQGEYGQAKEKYTSPTPNFDLAQVLREFLSDSRDKVVNSYSETQSSTILNQPTDEEYLESTTSETLEDANSKLRSSLPDAASLELKQKLNDSPKFSDEQPTEHLPKSVEKSYDNFEKEFKNDNYFVGTNHENSRASDGRLKTERKSAKISENLKPLLLTSQSTYTLLSAHNHSLKTVLEPPDVLNINSLQASSNTTVEESFKESDIVKSLSFDLDSPEDREQFEAAQSKGLLKR